MAVAATNFLFKMQLTPNDWLVKFNSGCGLNKQAKLFLTVHSLPEMPLTTPAGSAGATPLASSCCGIVSLKVMDIESQDCRQHGKPREVIVIVFGTDDRAVIPHSVMTPMNNHECVAVDRSREKTI